MSNSHKSVATSRRSFLKDAAITSAIAATGSTFAELALASRTPPVNRVKLLDLGVAPAWTSPGPTLLQLKSLTFLAFHAAKLDSAGHAVKDGTAVIELHGYVCGKFRCRGDEPLAPHPVDLSDLEPCEVFEVENSSWAKHKAIRHFIFRFLGVTRGVGVGAADFECLAKRITANFFTQPFADILDILES